MTRCFFQNQVAKGPGGGGVTWRHGGVFPICLDRWKAQSVHVFDVHDRARRSHSGLERSDRHGHGLEVGQENDKLLLSKTRLPNVQGGVTWRNRGVFPIRLDRWKPRLSTYRKLIAVQRHHTGAWSGWTVKGGRSDKKMTQFVFRHVPGCRTPSVWKSCASGVQLVQVGCCIVQLQGAHWVLILLSVAVAHG